MTYLDRAIKDGYAIITGPENKQKIIYVTSDNHTENYNDPEEKVRAEFWAELIYEYDYPAHRIKVEVTIPDRVPTDRADIVIFSDDECKKPYAVVECKRDGVTDAEFLQAIEQGVGNATWVKLRASYVVIIAGATRRVLDFSDDSTGILERENNIIADLPKAYGKPQAFRFYRGGEYTDVDGKKKKAPDIQPVAREDLITAIKKCHNTLWGGGRLSPPTAFGELCKLIFVKISDEQKPRKKGEPYQFQIKTHEPSSKLAKRINDLYNEQKVKDPEVFTDSIKVDDRVLRTVVSHLEAINLSKTDLDVKGVTYSSDEEFKTLFFAHLSQFFLSEKRVAEVKGERHSELKIVGIDQTQHISDVAPIISFIPNTDMTISKYLEKIRTLYADISARNLEKRIEMPEKIVRYTLAFNKPVEIDEGDRKIICSMADHLGINITEDFFILGNLSQSSIPTGIMGGYSFSGTDAEKEKYDTIQELLETISKALEWAPVEKAFDDKKCLKLALQNCGTDIDEDIEISLRIPKNSLLPISEFPKFDNDKMGYLLNDCDMSELFGICSTSTYSHYDSSIVTSRRFSPRVSTSSVFPGYVPNYNDDFESELADVFSYSCFGEGEEYIVKIKFDYIKHNTIIAFPSVIFIKAPFTVMPYTITSKNSPKVVSGEIKITEDMQHQ